jgi:DNA-directed RNA polymerase specialized sigma24 family protein
MQTLEHTNERAADLYWLAFLLTGDREVSLDVTVAALDLADGTNRFFSTWMLAWSRRVVIAKALAAIREELDASARRTASKRAEKSILPPPDWAGGRAATKAVLEEALLAIDVFPRCALLLSVFEGMSLEDAAILLDCDQGLVRKAQASALHELTGNLARIQGWTSTPPRSYVVTSELQHA